MIAVAAFKPARYVLRYLSSSPRRRDSFEPARDISWRRPGRLLLNLCILAGLIAVAVLAFRPAIDQIVQSPFFVPALVAASGFWVLITVGRGLSNGYIMPFSRGFADTYELQWQPIRFWASMGWNALIGCALLGAGLYMLKQAPIQALQNRCYDWKNLETPAEELSSCTKLIGLRDASGADHTDLIEARGSAYYRLGDYQRAAADYGDAAKRNRHDSSFNYNLGLADAELGYRGLAVDDFSAAIAADGKNTDAYAYRGKVYLDLGRFGQATADFTHVLEDRPRDLGTLIDRGVAYAWAGDQPRAERDFAAARSIDPSNVVILRGEAILRMTSGHPAAAADLLTEALRRSPEDIWSLAMRAQAYKLMGKRDEMLADVQEAKRLASAARMRKPAMGAQLVSHR